MAGQRVGLRRVYHSVNCRLGNVDELMLSFPVGECTVEVYFGNQPRYGISIYMPTRAASSSHLAPGFQVNHFSDVSNSPYAGDFFIEITSYVDASRDINDDTDPSSDAEVARELFGIADQHRPDLVQTLDIVAGTIGLRLDERLVMDMLCEDELAVHSGGTSRRFAMPAIFLPWHGPEVVHDADRLPDLVSSLNLASERAERTAALCFRWLLRAWSEHHHLYRFLNLFIPLEIILDEYTMSLDTQLRDSARALRRLATQYGGEDKDRLVALIDLCINELRPTLRSRFDKLAKDMQGVNDQSRDTDAFGKFYRIRNNLVHRGSDAPGHRVFIDDDSIQQEARDLDDLVERYVSYVLFGTDTN